MEDWSGIFGRDPHQDRMAKAIAALPGKPGLDVSMLGAGDLVCFSRNKVNGDRSYTRSAWEIISHNGYQIALRWAGGEKPYGGDEIIILMDEHDFYDGRMFAA